MKSASAIVVRFSASVALTAAFAVFTQTAQAQRLWPLILPESRTVQVRDPSEFPRTYVADTQSPPTVVDPHNGNPQKLLPLDEAIRVGLQNSEVVRVLVGGTATSSGSTIYDAPVQNTIIDQRRGRFDPTISVQNTWNHAEIPTAVIDPLDPIQAFITPLGTQNYNLNMALQQTNVTGGTGSFGVIQNPTTFAPGVFPLNPQNNPQLNLGYTQPLLQGGGVPANVAPIVIARLDTERSYFVFKDSMQDMVRGVIEAYWNVVFARTDVWAREQQVEQGHGAYERAAARLQSGFGNSGEVAQTRSAWANFRATLIASQANLLQREANLRNILGLPPTDPQRIIPVTMPTREQLKPDWNALVNLAAERRPDLIELKLIIEADQQQLIIANNQALPQANAVALYAWNGLSGTTPTGNFLSTQPGQYTNWTLGVNFSVPLGLRTGRAALRQRQLLLSRDRANLQQGIHQAVHILAANMRNLATTYQQYLAYRETREAARINLAKQIADNNAGRAIFLNVLQAITDWGNSVSAEANALANYNTELANVERQSGTILETHGVRFVEERYGSIGPLGRLALPVPYPESLPPSANAPRYPASDKPSETTFDLENPARKRGARPQPETLQPERLPAPLVPPLSPPDAQPPETQQPEAVPPRTTLELPPPAVTPPTSTRPMSTPGNTLRSLTPPQSNFESTLRLVR